MVVSLECAKAGKLVEWMVGGWGKLKVELLAKHSAVEMVDCLVRQTVIEMVESSGEKTDYGLVARTVAQMAGQ